MDGKKIRKRAAATVKRWTESKEFKMFAGNVGNGIMVVDKNKRVEFVNQTMVRMLLYDSSGEIVNRPLLDFFLMDEETENAANVEISEALILMQGGISIPVLMSATELRQGNKRIGALYVAKYINDNMHLECLNKNLLDANRSLEQEVLLGKQAIEKFQYYAHHDYLTDIPNGQFLFDRLAHALYLAERFAHLVVLYFIDIDGFKEINDAHGHHQGDLVLRETAKRIQGCIRKTDTVARIGGDEFAVLLPDCEDVEHADIAARKILSSIRQPFRQQGEAINISLSIGISIHPFHGREPYELLKNADAAMYQVKNKGKNDFCIYKPAAGSPEPEAIKDGRIEKENILLRQNFELAEMNKPANSSESSAGEERRKKSPKLSSVIDIMSDATIVFNLSGKVVSVNEEFRRLFGLEQEKLIGKFLMDMPGMARLDDKTAEHYMKLIRETMERGKGGPIELRFNRWDNKEMHVVASGGVTRDARDNPTHLIATLRDINIANPLASQPEAQEGCVE